MTIQLLKSKIFKLKEFEILARHKDLYHFLENRVYYTIYDKFNPNLLWDDVMEWIENNIEGIVIIEEADLNSFHLYFERDTDLSMFAVRWQGKDE